MITLIYIIEGVKIELVNDLVELYRKTASELPEDVLSELKKAESDEEGIAKDNVKVIIKDVELAKKSKKPICQDTGTPFFYIKKPKDMSEKEIKEAIEKATVIATEQIPLRPNAVDPISGKNIGNKPILYFEEAEKLEINLLMKGGGSENISAIYKLPNLELKANRDIDGIKKCVLDAVFKAQGKGCPPYIIGVAIGGTIGEVSLLAKKQLLRKVNDANEDKELADMEKDLLQKINRLGIGPSGLSGKTTALAIKLGKVYRHPASFFVGVSFGCWTTRKGKWTSQN